MTEGLSSKSRRRFIKAVTGCTIAVNIIPINQLFAQQIDTRTNTNTGDWSGQPGQARYRIDGLAKVTGQKIYARDFHAKDLPGWPQDEHPVMIVRAFNVDENFVGLDKSILPAGGHPNMVIYGDAVTKKVARPHTKSDEKVELDEIGHYYHEVTRPNSLTWPFIVQRGKAADFYGQPVAMMIFDDRKSFRSAKKQVQFNQDFQQYAGKAKLNKPFPFTPMTNFVRVAGDGDKDVFSYVLNGGDDDTYTKGATKYRAQIKHQMQSGQWQTYQNDCTMRAMDPVFMEPESGLGWYDAATKTLNLVVGTQSPDGDVNTVAEMFNNPDPVVDVKTVNLIACYPGGGFGGRDSSVFTLNLALAAAYAKGKPVRLAYDRFEQFQAGFKRHPCTLTSSLSVDNQGKIQALDVNMQFDGGGRENLSPWVAQLASLCAGGAYVIPRAAIFSKSMYSTNISGGSQRGFGGPQAFFAMETMLDEIATDKGWDPFDLRRRNLITKGDRTVTGGPIDEVLQLDTILNKCEHHALWQNRSQDAEHWAKQGLSYGVGFGLSMQAHGMSNNGVVGHVALSRDGKITVKTNAVDMGNGSATTLAVVTAAALGHNASTIEMGDYSLYPSLQMKTGWDKSWQDSWAEPDWTAAGVASSSACLTAYFQVHSILQASKVLFETAIVPAARKLWQKPNLKADTLLWHEGDLIVKGVNLPPISMEILAGEIYRNAGITGASVHAFNRGSWATADYQVNNDTFRWEVDGLILYQAGQTVPAKITRQNISYPNEASQRYVRTAYAPCGNLIGLTVDKQTGEVVVRNSVSVLNAGKVITEGLVSGQSQGGVAMAIGYALLEDMPPGLEGPAAGDWNLNRYSVALAGDIALKSQELITLPPIDNDTSGKGIAEAVMCSVAPAIANALYAATNIRFRDLPITAEKIRQGLKQGATHG
ncbi:MAG: xanthine dehydrogenase family protein molybdopterin-binding subunit [Algicola sp.]|nr:xanthine dehydrogenase family protein molybdopterin-binding subunit [Algicola sp.]